MQKTFLVNWLTARASRHSQCLCVIQFVKQIEILIVNFFSTITRMINRQFAHTWLKTTFQHIDSPVPTWYVADLSAVRQHADYNESDHPHRPIHQFP